MIDVSQLEQQLGLGKNEALALVYGLELERFEVGLGFASEGALWDQLAVAPHWQELFLGAPVGLFAWEEQSGVFRLWLPSAGEVHVLRGASRRVDPRTWLIDARTDQAAVRVSLESGDDLVLLLGRTECQFLRVDSLVDAPSIDSLTGGLASEEWLASEYGVLAASPRLADRVAAVGLVLRLWQPTSAEARAQLVPEALAAESRLVTRARQWVATLSPPQRGRCTASTIDDAEALQDALVAVDTIADQGDEALCSFATYIATERDRLQSIVAVLALRGDTLGEQQALDRLDEQAKLVLSQLSSAGIEHPMLDRAAELEPFAWWSAVASP